MPGRTSGREGVKMDAGRRTFLGTALAALGACRLLLSGQGVPQQPFPPPVEREPLPKPNARALLKLNQKELKHDAQRLLELAQALEKEVEKTDSAEVLSVSLFRKAEEIEKLAKHIKSLARG